jgi:hypothetical protein
MNLNWMLYSVIIVIDYSCIRFLSRRIVQAKFPNSNDKNFKSNVIISVFIFYYFRFLVYSFTLVLNFNSDQLLFVTQTIIFPMYLYLAVFYSLIRKSFFRFKPKDFALFIISVFICYFIFMVGETTWDGSAYHLPVELLIRDSGSLWNWPEVIFNQWGLIGGDIMNSLFHLTFQSSRAGIIPSVIFSALLVELFFSITKSYRYIIVAILLSIPSFTNQIASRYIDSSLAIGLLLLFIVVMRVKEELPINKNFSILIISAFCFSNKLSAITISLVIFLGYVISKNFKVKEKITTVSFGLFGLLLGIFPVFFRNLIEHNNPLFPFYFSDPSTGYLSLSKFSDQLQYSYLTQIGYEDESLFDALIYQYIYSPWVSLLDIFQNLEGSNKLSEFVEEESFYRTFVYDNRLGGFGPSILLMIILVFICYRNYSLALSILFLLVFMIIPTSIHPRYQLGLYFILIWVLLLKSSMRKILSLKFLPISYVLGAAIATFAIINIFTMFYRLAPIGFANYPEVRESKSVAAKLNPDCSPIVHIGSGLWFGDALWGPELCGTVLKSEYVNGYILDYKIGETNLSKDQINSVEEFALQNPKTLRIVCSKPQISELPNDVTIIPKIKNDPCSEIYNNLSKKFNLRINTNIIEQRVGPNLSVIKLIGAK